MSLWRHLTRGIRVLARRDAADADIRDEVADYVERSVDAHVRAGLSPESARRAARIDIGNPTVARETVRSYGWERGVERIAADVRYALRRLRRDLTFTIASVLTLAMGIGASTAIYSAVRPVLFASLPYPDADRLVTLSDYGAPDGRAVAYANLREIEVRGHSFQTVSAMTAWQPTLTGRAEPERLDGQRVTANYFRTLGVLPVLGRPLDGSEDHPGGAGEVVMSNGLWRRRFGGDSGVVGRQVDLDGVPFLVVGIMPRGFENIPSPTASVWTLLQADRSLPTTGFEWYHNVRGLARLRPGISVESAQREVAELGRHRVGAFARPPWSAMARGLVLTTLHDSAVRNARPVLLAVLAAVGVLLVIACVNVTSLLLARGAQRRAELAMRATLGAGRGRLVAQLLTESVVLALVAGALGVVLARFGIDWLRALAPADLPRLNDVALNGETLAFALLVSTVVGVAIGVSPALRASRTDLHRTLSEATRRTAEGLSAARAVLVVAEVGLALMLLVSAGLLVKSLRRVFAIDPGFAPGHVLTMQLQTAGPKFDSSAVAREYFKEALDAAARVPGVQRAAYVSQLPLSGDNDLYGVHFERSPVGHDAPEVVRYAVSPAYFATMGIRPERGRLLDSADDARAPLAVVFNASFAARVFPGMDPIGQHVHIGPDSGPWYTVVGIVPDVKQVSLGARQSDEAYITLDQSWFTDRVLTLVVRTSGDAAALAPAIKRSVWSVDANQPITRVATMDAVLRASEAQRHFALVVFDAFALAALALATVGIYGMLAGSVSERRREIGVRVALGASPRGIVAHVMRQGMLLTGLGILAGLLGAAVAARGLGSLLFGVTPLDPLTYASVAAILALVGAAACWSPASRAASVDPAEALRAE